jgi:alpha-glucoside transport system permease protein
VEGALPVELTFRTRAAGRQREGGVFVIEGNVFADPEQARWFPTAAARSPAFGTRGAAPTEFRRATTAELRRRDADGRADGGFRSRARGISAPARAIYFEAARRRSSRSQLPHGADAPTAWTGPSSTR